MLLIQNYWDDLEIRSFRVCLRPPGYVGKSSKNLEVVSNKNLINMNENMKYNADEEIKVNNEENQDKDMLKKFYKNQEDDFAKNKKEEVIDTILYKERNKEENKENNREEIKIVNEGKPKKRKFTDLKKNVI